LNRLADIAPLWQVSFPEPTSLAPYPALRPRGAGQAPAINLPPLPTVSPEGAGRRTSALAARDGNAKAVATIRLHPMPERMLT